MFDHLLQKIDTGTEQQIKWWWYQPRSEMWWKWNKSTTTDKTSRQMVSQSPLLRCCKSNSLKWNVVKKIFKRHWQDIMDSMKNLWRHPTMWFAIIKLVPVSTFEWLWPRVLGLGGLLLVYLGPWSDNYIIVIIIILIIFTQLTWPPQCWCLRCLCPTPLSLGAIWQFVQ